ncbi:MAG: hypothetical protein JNK85_03815 [Verrucomicrobiales bacterium]|nr:hypothetical protein [Verrucomicrobiales bacterium]
MTKTLIIIFMVLVAVFIFTELTGLYDRTAKPKIATSEPVEPTPAANHTITVSGQELPGMPAYLEDTLAKAHQEGVEALGKWLKTWQKKIQDPRLAWIELDYIVLLNLKDHKAARERFLAVQARIPETSPVYSRVQKLAPAYEQ